MAGAPRFKVYTTDNQYVGCLKDPSDAAAVVALYGEGAQIRDGHSKKWVVWTEGKDGDAGESFDCVAETINERITARNLATINKRAATL